MAVDHIEVLVEEPSMEAALRILLPKLVGELSHSIYVHQCKQELLERLPSRLRAYAQWLPPTWRVVVLLDRDDDDCEILKARVEEMARDAGLTTKSASAVDWQVVNRLVIEELEAWYFGDWAAVKAAYPRVSNRVSGRQQYRNPDAIRGGTWEAFERVLQRVGYFPTGLRKIEAARVIAAHMDPGRNRSRSFQVLCQALQEMSSR